MIDFPTQKGTKVDSVHPIGNRCRDRRVTPEQEGSIAAALTERLSQRAVARLLKVSRDTIRRTLKNRRQASV
jgi:hypothetical protein